MAHHPADYRAQGLGDRRAIIRALAQAMGGSCIVRDTSGRTLKLTQDALQVIDVPSHEDAQ